MERNAIDIAPGLSLHEHSAAAARRADAKISIPIYPTSWTRASDGCSGATRAARVPTPWIHDN
jgi:hypothetical protein